MAKVKATRAAKQEARKVVPLAEFDPKKVAAARQASLDKIITEAAKKHGPGCVERAENTNCSYLLRRPTGLISLDIAMAGGWPAAAPSVLVGPDGAGKDYMLWRTAAESQRLYGQDFCMACYFTEFKPDKLYMKDRCGFQIAFSEDEIEELDRARVSNGKPSLNAQAIDHYRHQIGNFLPIFGLSADHGFDLVFDFLEQNYCQIVAVNSIGFLQTEAKEDTDSFEEFAQQRNEATLLNKALPKFAMYMNRKSVNGRPNETSLILVNQVRSKDAAGARPPGRVAQEKDSYKTAANAWALKHGKAIELFLHNGKKIWDLESKPPYALGRIKEWEITKGKLGTHEGIRGEFNYFYGEGADIIGDLADLCLSLGIIEGSSWYSYDSDGFKFKTQGMPRLLEVIRHDIELQQHLRMRCYQETGTICRHL